MADFPHKDLTYAVIGACIEVYNEQGNGFLEPVYQESLSIEFELRKIQFEAQRRLTLNYKGRELKQVYIPDFVVAGEVVLELKAVSALLSEHRAQTLNYLRATKLKVGLLVNFGNPEKLEWQRLVL
jgi:GxxExxY protein